MGPDIDMKFHQVMEIVSYDNMTNCYPLMWPHMLNFLQSIFMNVLRIDGWNLFVVVYLDFCVLESIIEL